MVKRIIKIFIVIFNKKNMKLIKQCDSAWGNIKLGNSNQTICQSGCLTTDLSSLSEWYGSYINPGKLAKLLKYTNEGYLLWNSINSVLPFEFVYRYYYRDDAKIKEILASKDNACILQVNHKTHWVALVGYSRITGYKVFDPAYGDIINLSKRYKDINGFAEVKRQ